MKRVFFLILAAVFMMTSACKKEDIAAIGIEFYPKLSELTLEIGDIETMRALVTPINASDKEVTWFSNKPAIAMVNNKGEITAKAIGTATITITTKDGGHTANCVVEVIPTGQKKMTITKGSYYDVNFVLGGKSTFTIDWNDGSQIETHSFMQRDYSYGYYHSYPDQSSKTITFTGGNISYLSIECYVTSLDISDNIALTMLNCNGNGLKELDVSNNTILKHLSCNNNQLESLDLSNNTLLKSLSCNNNQIESLDLSKNTSLTSLSCRGDSSLTILDLSNNVALTILKCTNNKLRMLDVSKNTALVYLLCYNNKLDTDALNALFKTLHSNAGTKYINIAHNPGTNECDRSIATNKGWTVTDSIPPYVD